MINNGSEFYMEIFESVINIHDMIFVIIYVKIST